MENYTFKSDRLKDLRRALNIKQEQMAKDLNISTPTLSRYETGERQPNLQTLFMLSGYLNVSADYFLDRPLSHPNFDQTLVNNDSLPGIIANTFKPTDLSSISEKRVDNILYYISDQIALSKLKDGNRL